MAAPMLHNQRPGSIVGRSSIGTGLQRALMAPRAGAGATAASVLRPRSAGLQQLAARPDHALRLRPSRAASVRLSGSGDQGQERSGGLAAQFKSLFQVYSDPMCNQRLLVLVVGQMLCSIATLIHDSYLPVYAQDVLGLSNTSIGAVQGLAQFLCQLTKGVSGVAGDLLGSQVRVLVFGTFLTLVCKPMFVMLSSVYTIAGATACLYWFFFAKLMDRMSKGIREAPTKAVMNELAHDSGDSPDAAYGLRQSLATAGMLGGSTIAALTFAVTKQNYELTFAIAIIPPALALVWMVRNFGDEVFGSPQRNQSTATAASASLSAPAAAGPQAPTTTSETLVSVEGAPAPPPEVVAAANAALSSHEAKAEEPVLTLFDKAKVLVGAFKPVYWQALIVVGVLYFARFDASFLSLRAKSIMAKTALPMLTLVNTLIQVVMTAPLAKFSGQSVRNRNLLLLAGFALMVGTNCCFGLPFFANTAGMFMGAVLLGLHMAMTHSITVSMIASYMPTGSVPGIGKLSGTAVSFTDFLLGFVLAASNTVAGVLSDMTRQAGLGNTGCFAGGAMACCLAATLLLVFERWGDLGKDELVFRRAKAKKAA